MRLVGLACLFVVVASGLAEAGPLDKPAFTATPAELLAEGRAAEPYLAWQQLARGFGGTALDDADRYVLGRIAEAYGLRDDAVRTYRQIARPAHPDGVPSTWDFCQKRLKAMGVTP